MNQANLPTISVIVPVYNAERTLQDCLESLLNQEYPEDQYEVIIVDNNSNDASTQIASRYQGIRLLRQTEIQSSYAARNMGVDYAQGEIIAFTDADCIPKKDWLLELAAPFASSSVLAVGGSVKDASPTNMVEAFICEANPLGQYQDAPGQFLRPLITANTALRKNVFIDYGGFNAKLYTGADIDLAWRLQIRCGDCIRYAMEAVVYHRHRSTLKSMFRQYRRHGFGEIFLDAIYHQYPGYPRTFRYQISHLPRQVWALMKGLRSFIYRLARYPFKPDRYYLFKPLFWSVAESGNIWGKIQGLWSTRGLRINPTSQQWQDPGG